MLKETTLLKMRLEPVTPQFQVKYYTTELLHSTVIWGLIPEKKKDLETQFFKRVNNECLFS